MAPASPSTAYRTRRASILLALATTVISPSAGRAADRADRGRTLLTENCASCHAVGRTGQSPLPAAPPFRTIADRLDMDELFERMREGLSSAHRDMPTFRFTREDAHAIRSYLNTIQQ